MKHRFYVSLVACGGLALIIGVATLFVPIFSSPNPDPPRNLYDAVLSRDTAKVRDALAQIVDLNERDPQYRLLTPVFLAVSNGDREIAELLLSKGADPDLDLNTPSMQATLKAARDGDADARQWFINSQLLRTEDDVEVLEGVERTTPLWWAANFGRVELVELLLRFNANPNTPAMLNMTPLNVAAAGGHKEAVKILLRNGVDIENTGSSGSAPLVQAASAGFLEVVVVLLEQGARADIGGGEVSSPMHAAAANGHTHVIEYLIDHGVDVNQSGVRNLTAMHAAAFHNRLQTAESLLEHGADLDALTTNGQTPLHLAARAGQMEMLRWLIDQGAAIDLKSKDFGQTPLYRAALGGHLDAVKTLYEAGADHDARTDANYSPLHVSAWEGHTAVVRWLVQNNVEIDPVTTDNRKTPLHYAAQGGHLEIVRILLKARADPNAVADKGFTPLKLAQHNEHADIATLIESYITDE